MKALLDSCVWGGASHDLEEAGNTVIRVADWGRDPGDEEVLSFAHREGCVLITLDKDFGELAIVLERPHSGIVRLVNIPARQQGAFAAEIITRFGSELQAGAIVTAGQDRIRVRPATVPPP